MTIQKPIGLQKVLSQDFSNDELASICFELSVDVEDLPTQKSSRARELIRHAQRWNKLDKLLGWLASDRPQTDFYPYLYLIVIDRLNTIADMQQLSSALGINYDVELVKNLGYFAPSGNADVIEKQAWRIYEMVTEAERQGELLWAMKNLKPNLDLGVFELKTPPKPPTGQGAMGKPAEVSSDDNGVGSVEGMVYENFDLRINEGSEGVYDVEVLFSPQGEVKKIPTTFTLGDTEFKDLLAFLKDLWADKKDAVSLGKKMKPLLFPGDVWSKFRECRTAMRNQGKGLRVRLRIDPPELSSLPWEYVHDDTFDYLAHDKLTPIVRYPAESLPQEDLSAKFPIRILLATANPSDLTQLEVDKEEALVKQALEPLEATGLAEVTVIRKAQISDVRKELTDGKYHVFHFIGHGMIENDEGALALENDEGKKRAVFASQLRAMLRNTGVRFIFLNSCETAVSDTKDPISGVAQSLVRAGIPAVMAMQFEVPDKTSLLFSRQLYASLVLGKPLDQAVTEMRRAAYIDAEDMVFWGIPVLFMRAPDGVIWQADEEAAKKLAAYSPKSPLVKAVDEVETAFPGVQGNLDADATAEFKADLATVQEWAAGTPDDKQRARIVLKLKSMAGLLEVYGIAADSLAMQALQAALNQAGGS